MRKEKTRSGKRNGFWCNFRSTFPVSLVCLIIFGAAMFLSFQHNKVIVMGKAGFIRDAAWRIGLGGVAVVVAVCCVRRIWKQRKSIKGLLGRILGAIACLLMAFFLVRPCILDIPYFEHPVITYLELLKFDADYTGDGPTRYYLRGRGIDGNTHSFSLNAEVYEEGRELWFGNLELRAKVAYLPHTDVVMSLQYLSGLDEQSEELFPHSASLPNAWESFSIQINDQVYALPAPLSTFLENGWMLWPRKMPDYSCPGQMNHMRNMRIRGLD